MVHLRTAQFNCRLSICVVMLVTLSCLSATQSAELQRPPLVVAAEPQGEETELRYKLDNSDLVALFYVRNTGDVEVEALRLSALLHETNQSRRATLLQLSRDGKRLDEGRFVLSPGETIAIELKATGLPLGPSSGYLLLEHGDQKFTLAPLSFDYSLPPELKIVGLAKDAELQGTAKSGTYEHVFAVQSQNDTPIEVLRATTTPVTGPDGIQRTSTIELVSSGQLPIALKGHAAVELRLTTAVPITGIYKGTIILSFDQHTVELPFAITRAKVPLPFEILPSDAVRLNLGMLARESRVRIAMHELEGVSFNMQKLPELTTLNASVTGQKSYQTHFKGAYWADDAGNTVTSLQLSPGELQALWLVVSGVANAGEFAGSLRFGLEDGQVITQTISIIARRSMWLIVLLIASGILISQMLKLLGSRALNLEEQQQLSRIDSNAARLAGLPALTREGRSILEQLRARVLIVFTESQANRGTSYAATISELDRKVRLTPSWDAAAVAVRAILPPATELLSLLKELQNSLLAENPSVQALESLENKLAELKTKIDKKALETIADAIQVLQRQIARYEELCAPSSGSSERLRVAKDSLRSAAQAINDSSLDTARKQFEQAALMYATSLVQDLNEQIQNPPSAFAREIAPAAWANALARLNAESSRASQLLGNDPNAAIRVTWSNRASYWQVSLQLAIHSVQNRIRTDQNPPQPDLAQLTSRLELLKGYADRLHELLAAEDLSPEDLLTLEREIEIRCQPAGATRSAIARAPGDASSAVPLTDWLQVMPFFRETHTGAVRLADIHVLRSKRLWNQFWVMFLSGVVATILGLKLLWVDNLVWGTTGDCLIAILWGLGLHQVANASFDYNTYVSGFIKPPSQQSPV